MEYSFNECLGSVIKMSETSSSIISLVTGHWLLVTGKQKRVLAHA